MSMSGLLGDHAPDELPKRNETSPATGKEPTSGLEGFINNFLREQNIRWMLVIGAAIVFASSLMLVSREFSHWPVGFKYLTVLAYTGIIFGAAEVGRSRLGLQATSKVLHVLTLFLLPVCFLALNWATSSGIAGSTMAVAEAIAFGIPAAAFLWFAANRIFDHLLRGRQTTFVVAYTLLSIAGAMPRIANPFMAFGISLVLWFVMTAGMIKVNRHLFWMSEEHRWPRIFAFFPSMLLGIMFILIVFSRTGHSLSLEWIGFGCVLVSATILMTTRTIADVFRQRTGNLVRPLPWSIVLPMLGGLISMVLGIGLAFSGFPSSLAIVPTCVLATGMLAFAARETGHRGFVWASLATGLMAYQFSPTLFLETAVALRDAAASGLQTQKLPFAFYGLTYLPLILGVSAMYRAVQRRGHRHLVEPLRTFACGLAVILQAAALTNGQAMFVVSAVNIAMFFALGAILRDRRIASISLVSMVAAATMMVPFFSSESGSAGIGRLIIGSLSEVTLSLGVLGSVLAISRIADRLLRLIPLSDNTDLDTDDNRSLGEYLGLSLSLAVGLYALTAILLNSVGHFRLPVTVVHCLLPVATFLIHTLRNRNITSGFVFWTLLLAGSINLAINVGHSLTNINSGVTLMLGIASIVGTLVLRASHANEATDGRSSLTARRLFSRQVENNALDALLIPLNWLSLGIMTFMTAVFHLPMMLLHTINHTAITTPLATTLTVIWLIAATFLLVSRLAGAFSALAIPLLTSSLAVAFGIGNPESWTFTFVVWAAATSISYALFSLSRSSATDYAITISRVWMLGILAVSTTNFNLEFRLVPLIVLPVVCLINRESLNALSRTGLAILANVHVILLIGGLAGEHGAVGNILDHPEANLLRSLFFVIVLSVIAFQRFKRHMEKEVVEIWQILLRTAGGVAVFASLFGNAPSSFETGCMISAFLVAVVFEFRTAVQMQHELMVWMAFYLLGGLAGWMLAEGIIEPGAGVSQLLILVTAVFMLAIAERCRGRERAEILTRPFHTVGLSMPMLVVLIALFKTTFSGAEAMRGLQTLAVFGSAAVYFEQWIRSRRRGFLLLAGGVVNVAFVLLWRTLHLSDPQFYMVPIGLSVLGLVEIMKKELPAVSHDPVRYIGALMILVSPVFEILGGSWAHLMSLLVLSTVVVLLSIGLRLRALMYTGTAFIVADLAGMIFRATVDRPGLLWIGGLALGAAVITLAAICENHRDRVLARIRKLSAALATWE